MSMKRREPLAVSAAELGRWLGVTDRRVRQLATEEIVPRGPGRGKYPLFACVRAYIEYLQGLAQRAQQPRSAGRQRLENAQASLAELKLARELGQVVAVETFERLLEDAFGRVQGQLRALGPRLAADLAAAEVQERNPITERQSIIDRTVEQLIEELHRADDVPDPDDEDGDRDD